MAAARKAQQFSGDCSAEGQAQISYHLHLLQDHQRLVPSPSLVYQDHDHSTGEIPSFKLIETGHSYAFLDINPVSKGHALVIPKDHTVKMHELSDEYLADAIPIAKKIALAQGLENYNILQNNGRMAHQQVDHVHFHVIPKPNETEGLVLNESCWPAKTVSMEELKAYHAELTTKLEALGKL